MKNYIMRAGAPLLVVLLMSLYACRKDTPEPNSPFVPIDYSVLPPATQTGAGTFGCLVDGEVWVPRVPLGAVTYVDKYALFSEKDSRGSGIVVTNLVDVDTQNDDSFTIAFSPSFFQPRTYQTLLDTAAYSFNPDFRMLHDKYQHIPGDTSNHLTITKIDTARNFISGEFRCVLYTANKSKSVKITDGRFDMIYYPE